MHELCRGTKTDRKHLKQNIFHQLNGDPDPSTTTTPLSRNGPDPPLIRASRWVKFPAMSERRYRGAILAAGLGTRLRPLTTRLPKPLVPVVGRPLLEYGLDALARAGIEEVGINAWHLGEALPESLRHRRERLTFVHEETLQGTGGGLRGIARALPPGPLLVSNGDALHDFDLAAVLRAHEAGGGIATLVLRSVPTGSAFATVGIDLAGRVQRIAEVEGPTPHATLRLGAYTGVQVVEPQLLDLLPSEGECDVLRTAYREALARRLPIHGVFVPRDRFWMDVGTIERYLEAHAAILDGRLETRVHPGVHPTARIHPSAQLHPKVGVAAGAVVEAHAHLGAGCYVARGARVEAGAQLAGVVVWEGAVARGALLGTVVMD